MNTKQNAATLLGGIYEHILEEEGWKLSREEEFNGCKVYAIPTVGYDPNGDPYLCWFAQVEGTKEFVNEKYGYQSLESWCSLDHGDLYKTSSQAIEAGKQAIREGKLQ